MVWFGSLWRWLWRLFARRVNRATRPTDPDESDWDWTKSSESNPDIKCLSVIIRSSDASLFFGEIAGFVERGFGSPQIAVILNKLRMLSEGERWYVEYYVRAFGRGTPLQIASQKMDDERVGLIIWSDSALSFEIGALMPRYEQSGEAAVASLGLN